MNLDNIIAAMDSFAETWMDGAGQIARLLSYVFAIWVGFALLIVAVIAVSLFITSMPPMVKAIILVLLFTVLGPWSLGEAWGDN